MGAKNGPVGWNGLSGQPVHFLCVQCLVPRADERPSPADLLTSDLFDVSESRYKYIPPSFPTLKLRSADLRWPTAPRGAVGGPVLERLTVQEIYSLWQLAGGDVVAELRKHGLMVTTPPVLAIPTVVTGEGQPFGQPKQRAALLDPTVIVLPIGQLQNCLNQMPPGQLLPSIISDEPRPPGDAPDQMTSLPLVIRERDVKYQCRRASLYRRLLYAYPFKRSRLWKEALTDVVPQYRAQVWAALLNIETDVVARYEAIDKESPSPVDRQIEVDIPRCHQYSELLASPEGHRKLKRVLKAWVADNPNLVYWQGLDSLAAPFLYLNFNDEALAWACLSAFIPKYLNNIFLKDNAAVIKVNFA